MLQNSLHLFKKKEKKYIDFIFFMLCLILCFHHRRSTALYMKFHFDYIFSEK